MLESKSFGHQKTGQQGFTLIEVLIAIVILAVGVMTLATMQTTGIKGNATANRISTASTWSANWIEELFALDYDAADLLDDVAPNGVAGLDEIGTTADGSKVSPDGNYTVYWNVAENSPMPDVKQIRVIIIRKQDGSSKPVVMNYMKPKYM